MINIDGNTIRLMINKTGERYRCCTDDNHSDHKFITNYLTSDIIKLLKLDLEIFTIDGLVSVVNVIIDIKALPILTSHLQILSKSTQLTIAV